MEKVAGNILKHQLGNKSFIKPFFAFYDFEIIIVEIDDQSKLEEISKERINHAL